MSPRLSRHDQSSSEGEFEAFKKTMPCSTPVAPFVKKQRDFLVALSSKKQILAPTAAALPEKRPEAEKISSEGKPLEVFTWSPKKGTEWDKKAPGEIGFCEFLKVCAYCKDKFKKDNDIFMYGYFGAYCSRKCRYDQMKLDGVDVDPKKEKLMGKKEWS